MWKSQNLCAQTGQDSANRDANHLSVRKIMSWNMFYFSPVALYYSHYGHLWALCNLPRANFRLSEFCFITTPGARAGVARLPSWQGKWGEWEYKTEMRSTLEHWVSCCCPLGPPPALAIAVVPSLPSQQEEAACALTQHQPESRTMTSSEPLSASAQGTASHLQSQCHDLPPADKWGCVIIWHPSMSGPATESLSLAA